MRSTLVAVLLALSLALPTLAEASDWTIDGAHSAVSFKIRHMMVSWVRGTFDKVSGTVHLDRDKLEAIAESLLERETLETSDLALILNGESLPPMSAPGAEELDDTEDPGEPNPADEVDDEDLPDPEPFPS